MLSFSSSSSSSTSFALACSTPAEANTQTIKLKLLVDKSSNKVLCAEASKEFVDFLFGLLQIPIGCMISLLRQNGLHISSGNSFARIHESVVNLEKTYFQSDPVKESLLIPTVASCAFPLSRVPPMLEKFVPLIHICETDRLTSMGHRAPLSPSLFGSTSLMSSRGSMSSSTNEKAKVIRGFVKEDNTKFMVVDNLMVTPWSDISLLTLINRFNIKDFNSVEERNVNIDFKKSLEIVMASFQSDTVLTDVLIGKTTSIPAHVPLGRK